MAAAGRRKTLRERVVFVRSGKWVSAELPSFPGAYGQGRTQAEAFRDLLSAIRDLVDSYQQEARSAARRASVG
jgi:predicted RNase H-like HicB family nuclease